MLFKRRQQTLPPINPALFLNQTLRSLHDAKLLEEKREENPAAVPQAFRIYAHLIQYVLRRVSCYRPFTLFVCL